MQITGIMSILVLNQNECIICKKKINKNNIADTSFNEM